MYDIRWETSDGMKILQSLAENTVPLDTPLTFFLPLVHNIHLLLIVWMKDLVSVRLQITFSAIILYSFCVHWRKNIHLCNICSSWMGKRPSHAFSNDISNVQIVLSQKKDAWSYTCGIHNIYQHLFFYPIFLYCCDIMINELLVHQKTENYKCNCHRDMAEG